ncbi:hypothetical protein [Fodinicola feengrottensis]|nr:hypothetical protein [Fodinicola feengrottensis]
MMNPPADPQVRSEPLLRMFLLSTLDAEDARPLLRAHADSAAATIDWLRRETAEIPADPDETQLAQRILNEIGLRQNQAEYDWAMWAIAQLN